MEIKLQDSLRNNFCVYEKRYDIDENHKEGTHSHRCHEVFLLLEGNMNYFAEGTIFPLISDEIVIIGAGTPHGKKDIKCCGYSCFVMSINHEFFVENNCEEYEKVFLRLKSNEHKISADVCKSSGFLDAYRRLK